MNYIHYNGNSISDCMYIMQKHCHCTFLCWPLLRLLFACSWKYLQSGHGCHSAWASFAFVGRVDKRTRRLHNNDNNNENNNIIKYDNNNDNNNDNDNSKHTTTPSLLVSPGGTNCVCGYVGEDRGALIKDKYWEFVRPHQPLDIDFSKEVLTPCSSCLFIESLTTWIFDRHVFFVVFQLTRFLTEVVEESSPTARLVKAFTQSIIAPPVIEMTLAVQPRLVFKDGGMFY